VVGGDGLPTQKLLSLAGGHIPETYALSHFSLDDQRPVVKEFISEYREQYEVDPSPFSALGYDAMMLLADAAKRAGSFDSKAIRNTLESTDSLSLTTGEISFDEHRNPIKDAVVVRILPTHFEYVQRVRP